MTAVDQLAGVQLDSTTPGRTIVAGDLRSVVIPDHRSRILATTGGKAWLFSLRGGKGWFRKDHKVSLDRGRELCAEVREVFSCGGFLTTDELPRYGFNRYDRATLFEAYPEADPARDVLVVLAYDDRALADGIRTYIIEKLSEESELG